MQIGMTYNLLVWDKPNEYLPFPPEAKTLAEKVDWGTYIFNTSGLPLNGATYSLIGNQLYFESGADGKISVRKEEATGEFLLGVFLTTNEPAGFNYFFTFKIIILKGVLVEAVLHQTQKFEPETFKQQVETYSKTVKKIINRQQKWWYKWLYMPYAVSVRGAAFVLSAILIFIKEVISWIAFKITPI